MQQTHLETAVWRTRSPAPLVWVWTGWGLGSKHLAEPEKAMRSNRARKSVSGGCTAIFHSHQYFNRHFIQQPELWIWIFFLPSKEEQMSRYDARNTNPAAPRPGKALNSNENSIRFKAHLLIVWQWHLKENRSKRSKYSPFFFSKKLDLLTYAQWGKALANLYFNIIKVHF